MTSQCPASVQTPGRSFSSSQVAAGVEGLRCVHRCPLGWSLSLLREEEDLGITVGAPDTFRSCYSVTATWVNIVLCALFVVCLLHNGAVGAFCFPLLIF